MATRKLRTGVADLGRGVPARAVSGLTRAAIVTSLFAGGFAEVAGQAGVVRGRVVRADGPVGLADVELVVSPSGATTRTDGRGDFEFLGVAAGQVEVAARLPGFVTAIVALSVDAVAATEVDISLEPVWASLDPIVVSATPDPRSLFDVARAVSVTDSSAIRRGRTVGLHEPLRTVPGVQVISRYGTDDVKIGIRGSAARAGNGVRGVAVLLDGVPLTEPDGVARLDLVELAAAQSVEVVRGPASALHAGSPGGVVNIVSQTGRDSPGITVQAHGGAFGFRKYDGQAGWVFADGDGSGMIAASSTSVDGYRNHSDADILRGQIGFDYMAGLHTQLTFQATGSRLESRLPGSVSQPEFDADRRAAWPAAAPAGYGREDHRYRAGGRLETALGDAIVSGYFFFGGRTMDLPIPSEVVDLDLHRIQGGGRLRSVRIARLPLLATVGFDYDGVFGTDHRWENIAGAHGSLHDDGRFSGLGIGAYAHVEWDVSPTVTATLGLRSDRMRYRFQSETPGSIPRQERAFQQESPRLAAVWRPDAVTSVSASVGRGFEVPAVGEVSLSPGDPIRTVRPKSLWNYEVGARRTVGDRALLEVAAFFADVRGEFVRTTVGGVDLPENASRSRNIGVELGARALATPWLEVRAGYAFLDLKLQEFATAVLDSTGTRVQVDFSGKRVPAVPRHRVTGDAQVRALDRLGLGVQVEWQGTVYVETGNADEGTWYVQVAGGPVQPVPFRAVPASALVHLNADVRVGPATLSASVENLFGRTYTAGVVANEYFGRFYEPGSPTSLSLGLSLAGWQGASRSRS